MGVDASIDITTEDLKTVLALLQRHLPDTAAWVYGSRVKWTSTPKSDLDLVVFATPEQRRQVGDLREAFEESNLPFRIDLFVWEEVSEAFRKQIETEHTTLVAATRHPLSEPSCRGNDEWLDATIDAIAASSPNAVVGGPFGSNLVSRDYVPEGVPVIRGQNMGGRWVTGAFVFVTDEKAHSLKANLAQPNDIVLTQRGTLGQVSIVPSALPCCLLSQSQMKVTVDREIADPLFFYYVLSSGEQQDYVRQNAIQTGVPHTNLGILRSTPVPVPPLKEQRAIAHILGTLDDKIELNRRMNATLEAIARALFKSWFVDFDPVRAKMERRDTGLPKDIADLFPDRLVDSELGEIPEGWAVGHVEDGFEIVMGQSPPGHTYNDTGDGLPFFQGRSDFGFRYPKNRKFCTAPNRMAQPWDTIVSVRAPVGDINMAWERCCIGRGVAALRPRSGAVSYGYCATQALQTHMREYEHTGTVFGAINRKQLARLPLQQPTPDVVRGFEEVVHPWDQTIRLRTAEVATLTALRDTLLPKLVSGKLRTHAIQWPQRGAGSLTASIVGGE